MTLTVVVIPLFTGEAIGVNPKTGEVDPEQKMKPFENFIVAGCMTVLKYLIMIGLYVGVVCIIYGACTFKPPAGMWPGETIPPPAPAVACTFIMSCAYFIIYALVQFARTWTQFTQQKLSKFENAMLDATKAMFFGPMLCVLFIGARMRALQMDPLNGAPQKWAQNCFFMCTYAVIAQVLISIAVPLVLGGSVKKGKVEGDMEYEGLKYPILGSILSVGRWIIMICIYVGAACVIYSVFTIQHPQGEQYTPPISVTMQCVINLTFQFFFVYIGIWTLMTIKEFTKFEWEILTNTIESMVGTVAYCPMLSILFVGTRMRALLITNNKGAPQGWVQDGMYMATWAVLIQFLMCLLVGLGAWFNNQSAAVECDDDGTPKWTPGNPILVYVASALKWITFLFLYGGIIAVIVGVYTMTPETANGRGSFPLAGDGKVPIVDAKVPGYSGLPEPVGINDVTDKTGVTPAAAGSPAAAQPPPAF